MGSLAGRGAKRAHRLMAVVPGQRYADRDRQKALGLWLTLPLLLSSLLTWRHWDSASISDWPRFALAAAEPAAVSACGWAASPCSFQSVSTTCGCAGRGATASCCSFGCWTRWSGSDAPWYWFALPLRQSRGWPGCCAARTSSSSSPPPGASLLFGSYALARRRGDLPDQAVCCSLPCWVPACCSPRVSEQYTWRLDVSGQRIHSLSATAQAHSSTR